ncbi:MAG TPA: DNA-processing protein DprA [Cytophagaceae bacterium]|jgi:DNA processing protein
MSDKLIYEVGIGLIPNVGSQTTRLLVSYCGSPEQVFKSKKGHLLRIPGVGPTTADAIINQNVLTLAEKEVKTAEKQNIQILFYTNPLYPLRLKSIQDAPTLLYYNGNANLNNKKSIAIVGTRNATEYGKSATEDIVQDLKTHNALVVSGLAYGIDIAAHKASIKTGLETIGVMASGVDIIYPSVHNKTAAQMIESGGLLTEYPFGTTPEAVHFPARNRIIAGMVDAVIVVEAAEKGGALITAEIANSYNKEVFAVPGNLGMKVSAGCNKLIASHKAQIYTSIKDLEYLLNWDIDVSKEKIMVSKISFDEFPPDEKEILTLLHDNTEIMIDELSWKSQIPASRLASLLLTLEFQGLIKVLPGKKFKLNT